MSRGSVLFLAKQNIKCFFSMKNPQEEYIYCIIPDSFEIMMDSPSIPNRKRLSGGIWGQQTTLAYQKEQPGSVSLTMASAIEIIELDPKKMIVMYHYIIIHIIRKKTIRKTSAHFSGKSHRSISRPIRSVASRLSHWKGFRDLQGQIFIHLFSIGGISPVHDDFLAVPLKMMILQ